jgi:MinD superfamily P-loop ATPase
VIQLVILSGKGGTGKTTIAAALAHLASQEMSVVLADGDVDASNLELVLAPTKLAEHDFTGGQVAVIDPELCTACGICEQVCRFEAIVPGDETFRVVDNGCEGCASCFYQCPAEAIRMEEQTAGRWFHSSTRFGPLYHAHLFAGQENSGKLVTLVKQQARLQALDNDADLLVVDGPPGIGCPVIAASAGADLALLVVEPTVAGIHDLERILGTVTHFGVPAFVCINKSDLNKSRAEEIARFCADQQIDLVGQVSFDQVVTKAMVAGQPVTAYEDGPVTQELKGMWSRISEAVKVRAEA